jgi:hypothetical protein
VVSVIVHGGILIECGNLGEKNGYMVGVMLQVHLVSILSFSKNDVTIKITIGLVIFFFFFLNHKSNCNFNSHMDL